LAHTKENYWFLNVKGRHTGAKLSQTFTEVMVKWYIENRLFSLTLDNVSSNKVDVNDIISDLKNIGNGSLVCDGIFFSSQMCLPYSEFSC